jgi:hypothetical protein
MTSPSLKKLQITRLSTLQSKSADLRRLGKRLVGGFVFAALATGGAAAHADDQAYYPPATQTQPAPAAPAAQPAVAPNAAPQYQTPNQAQYQPQSPYQPQPQYQPQSPYPSAERWVRRSQQMRAATAQDAVPKPNDPSLPPLPPLELGPGPQQFGQSQSSGFLPPSTTPLPPVEAVAQRPLSPAQMPGGTQFREGPGGNPDYGAAPAPELIKKPSELPKVTQILPYIDYEPDPKLAKDNPCENQCPTPDGKPCKTRDGRILDCPKEIALSEGPFQPRAFAPSVFAWQASNVSYQPLYYEDPQLERYGHSYPFFVQPFVSIGRMTIQAAGIPYQMVIDPCWSCVYPLGYYRPGECSPKLIYQIPLNAEAALVEAGALTGVYFLFPHSAWAYATPGVK